MKQIIKLRFLVLFSAFTLCYLLATTYCLYAQDKIVAVVNNEVITQKDVKDFINFMTMQLSQEYRGDELKKKIDDAQTDLLNRLIEDRLILQEANKEKITYDVSRVKARIEDVKKRYNSEVEFQADLMKQGLTQSDIEKKIREQFLMYSIVEQKVRSKITVTPEEVTTYYEANKSSMVSGEEREFYAFSLENEDLAKSFSYGLKSGLSAEDLATRYPFTVNKITMRQGERLKPEIEEIVLKLGINEISEPVKISDKYYVFKLFNIIPSRPLQLTEVQNKIHDFLVEQKAQDKLTEWLNELKKQAYIQIR
ncbi:MAG: peptidyl-prolyl cis-trans isomerase [Candidatus Omnitrophica bacterium]|nr:peptidyl-prolyl cis-trans isomerase [Candidatus Omnitrophota bacterium]